MGFINAVLGKTGDDKFTSVEILENKSFMADILGGKSCVLDVRAQLKTGDMVNIEVQLRDNKNMDKRSLYYMSKLYSSELDAGNDYINLPNVIAINIVNFDFPNTKNYHSCFHLRDDEEPKIILTNILEIHFINMVKYRKQLKKPKDSKGIDDPLMRWLTWLNKDSPPKVIEEIINMDSAIQTADERLFHVTQDKEAMWAYTRYVIAECDKTSGLNNAYRKGSAEKSEEIARNLLAKGSTPEFIHETTGLSLEQIKIL